MLIAVTSILIINALNLPAAIVGVTLWVVLLPLLRWMAKRDPQFSKVYVRHLKYRRFYPARSRPYRTL